MRKQKFMISSLPLVAGEQKTSFVKVLEELNKEAEKQEAAIEATRTRCKICFREISPKRLCGGHGGHGGGGGPSGSGSSSEQKSSQGGQSPVMIPESTLDAGRSANLVSVMNGETAFNPEIIAELIAGKLLVIDNDRQSMTLNIQLQCEPELLSEEQQHELKKYMEAVLKEWNEFKEVHHLSDDCLTIDQDEDGHILSLRISLPRLALYDALIQRLANNLLPEPNLELQANNELKAGRGLAPNPFSMEPKPSNSKDKALVLDSVERNEAFDPTDEDDADQSLFNPSPLSTKLTYNPDK